jgi:hypothetical protein
MLVSIRFPSDGGMAVKLETHWVVGFTDGHGCFHVAINRHPKMKIGYQVLPEFAIVLHQDDIQMLHELKTFFGCGVVRPVQGDRLALRVRSRRHLMRRIIPFFTQHKLKTSKGIDFIRFRKVLYMMERREHLSPTGLETIRRIVEGPARPERSED